MLFLGLFFLCWWVGRWRLFSLLMIVSVTLYHSFHWIQVRNVALSLLFENPQHNWIHQYSIPVTKWAKTNMCWKTNRSTVLSFYDQFHLWNEIYHIFFSKQLYFPIFTKISSLPCTVVSPIQSHCILFP